MLSELELYRVKHILEEMAKANGVSESEIRKEIEAAIEAGFTNTDPEVRAVWEKTPFSNSRPSPEEFILWCAATVNYTMI